eukprot:3561024-Amphidinium_carterae.1
MLRQRPLLEFYLCEVRHHRLCELHETEWGATRHKSAGHYMASDLGDALLACALRLSTFWGF